MEIIKTLIWVVQIISAISIIILVLLQHGKGADATFGASASSASLFGASGAANFLSRSTAIVATIFFITTFSLVLLSNNGSLNDIGVMSKFKQTNNQSQVTLPTNNSSINESKNLNKGNVQNQMPN